MPSCGTVTRKGVLSAISEKLWQKIVNPIVFRYLETDSETSQGGTADGYEATTLIEVCDALIQARNDNALVDRLLAILRMLKEKNIWKWREFVRAEFRQWEAEFPIQFANMIYKLYGLKRKDPRSFKHPQFFGWFHTEVHLSSTS